MTMTTIPMTPTPDGWMVAPQDASASSLADFIWGDAPASAVSFAPPAPTVRDSGPDYTATEITGVVRKYREHGDEGFTVVTLDDDRTVVGQIDESDGTLSAGVAYRFFGRWTTHDRFGHQFTFDSFTIASRQAQMGVVAYLSRSDTGLTKIDAQNLWNAYGAAAIDRLRDAPHDVIADGVLTDRDDGKKAFRAADMLRAMVKDEPIKIALFELLGGKGFPRTTVKACIAAFGPKAPEFIRRDPFVMLVNDIPGVGFKRADKLFLELGGNPLRLKRQTLAAWHAMHVSGTGNTWETEGLLHKAILSATKSLSESQFDRAIELGLRAGWIRKRKDADGATWYAEADNAAAEQRLARHIARVRSYRAVWPTITEEDLPDTHQREKLAEIRESSVALLTGVPGSGKTYTAAVLIRKLLETIPSGRIAVCAPTGKAAVRITEAMRRYKLPLQATTIHQLLEIEGSTKDGGFKFKRCESDPLNEAVVVIDEFSMADTTIAAALFAAVPRGGNVLIIGDPFQLSPVGHGAPLRDMIAAGVPCALLTEIKRNSGAIVTACSRIKDGERFEVFIKPNEEAGLNLIHVDSDVSAQVGNIVSVVSAVRKKGIDPVWECQVLVATNEKSDVSRKQLNAVLQNALNPQAANVPVENRNPIFRPNDKVICLKNVVVYTWETANSKQDGTAILQYRKTPVEAYLANGDIGRVLAVDARSAIVKFMLPDRIVKVVTAKKKQKDGAGGEGDGAGGEGDGGDRGDFDLAYAITVHKSQGSEYPAVVVVIDEHAGPIGSREWWYTAISRASRFGFLVGKMKTAYKQAARVNLQKRKTFLAEDIIAGQAAAAAKVANVVASTSTGAAS